VELVRLDVSASDAEGRPIRDLNQGEIEVIESGERRPVLFFQHIEEPAESYAETASHTVGGEVSTNQGAARGHLYVLVFDQGHISPGNEQRTRLAAQQFLQSRLRPGDRAALYALPGPGPQIGFTADRRRLAAALVNVRGMAEAQVFGALGTMTLQEAFEILRGNEQMVERVAARVQAQGGATDVQRRSDPTTFGSDAMPLSNLIKEDAERIANVADGETRRLLATLADTLRPMAAIEGRKTVILVSEGFYGDRLAREVESVAAAAAGSYSVVYALDVNRHELDATADTPVGGDQATAIHDKISPLGSLAAETGGALFIDAARRAEAVFAGLADQTQDYYLVGFMPREVGSKDRGEYRRVTVRVTRRGAQVSTRTGFALTDAAMRLGGQQAIRRAMAAPFPQQGLPLQYTTYVMRGSAPGIERVILSLAVELPLAASSNDSADIVFLVRAAGDGHVAANGSDVIRLPTRPELAATTGTGIYRAQFELPAGDYLMRAVVREPGGLIGSADRRFTVRALGGPALAGSDLVLSSARGELPVRPTAYTGDGLTGVLELYGRTTDQVGEARVIVDLVPVGESSAVVSGSCDLQEVRVVGGGAAREARLALPLQGVAPGPYVARARVMVGPDTALEMIREVEVRAGQRPAASLERPIAATAFREDEADTSRFDPREVVNGTVGRHFAAQITSGSTPAAADGTRGLTHLAARDYATAIAAFQAVLAADERNGAAAFLLGWAYHGAGDDRQAISAWRRAVFIDPTLVSAHLALADLYVRMSEPSLALQALRAGLKALPESPELLDRLSRLERH
jgi:VWFA-related protein